ncbi:MAG: hypothetical protein H7235_10645 [Bdellovibrionaceae bacterium]|nr:hypothetical protein [Pseudobdellovibrionaceae bacterium]
MDNIWSSSSYALLVIVDPTVTNIKIRPGDYVRIHKLIVNEKGESRKSLVRSIKVGSVTSGKLVVENQEINWVRYLKMQLVPVIKDFAFNGRYVIYPIEIN